MHRHHRRGRIARVSVFEALQLFEMSRMYAAIFAAGALSYGLNLLFLIIERRFVHCGANRF